MTTVGIRVLSFSWSLVRFQSGAQKVPLTCGFTVFVRCPEVLNHVLLTFLNEKLITFLPYRGPINPYLLSHFSTCGTEKPLESATFRVHVVSAGDSQILGLRSQFPGTKYGPLVNNFPRDCWRPGPDDSIFLLSSVGSTAVNHQPNHGLRWVHSSAFSLRPTRLSACPARGSLARGPPPGVTGRLSL